MTDSIPSDARERAEAVLRPLLETLSKLIDAPSFMPVFMAASRASFDG